MMFDERFISDYDWLLEDAKWWAFHLGFYKSKEQLVRPVGLTRNVEKFKGLGGYTFDEEILTC